MWWAHAVRMYWGVLTADFQRLYGLDLGWLMRSDGCFDRLITLLTNLPSRADFHRVDTEDVMPKRRLAGGRNRPLNPGEYKPIERYAAAWSASLVT